MIMAATETFINVEDERQAVRTFKETVGGTERHTQAVVLMAKKTDGSLEVIKSDDNGMLQVSFA